MHYAPYAMLIYKWMYFIYECMYLRKSKNTHIHIIYLRHMTNGQKSNSPIFFAFHLIIVSLNFRNCRFSQGQILWLRSISESREAWPYSGCSIDDPIGSYRTLSRWSCSATQVQQKVPMTKSMGDETIPSRRDLHDIPSWNRRVIQLNDSAYQGKYPCGAPATTPAPGPYSSSASADRLR